MRYLTLDLETIPSQNPAVKAAIYARDAFRLVDGIGEIKAAGNLKDPAKIAESIAERTKAAERDLIEGNAAKLAGADKMWRETALDGWFGHIAVIGWAIDHHKVNSIECIEVVREATYTCDRYDAFLNSVDVSGEKTAIESFFRSVGNGIFVVVGHRVRRFDILYLWQRCIVLGIAVPNWLSRVKDSTRSDKDCIHDTSEMCGTTLTGKPLGPSLDSLCEALNLPRKEGIDGSKVLDAICAGRLGEVADYCRWDVSRARSVWRLIQGLKPLSIDIPSKPQENAA